MNDQDTFDAEGVSPADVAALNRIAELMKQRLGLDITLLKRESLMHRLLRRLRSIGLSRLDEYVEQLTAQPNECDALGMVLRPSAPALFRDPRLFSGAFALLNSWATDPRPRHVWVPACGAGDEVFAFALMSLRAGIPELTVVGTDTDSRVLSAARDGALDAEQLRGIPKVLRPWIVHGADSGTRTGFSAELLQRCQFVRQDLLQAPPRLGFDLISCRGVLSRLEMSAQRLLLEQLHAALAPAGRLIVSENEEGLMHRDLFVEVDAAESQLPALFRRVERRRGVQAPRQSPLISNAHHGEPLSVLHDAFEMSRDPTALLDAAGIIQAVNAAWRDQVSRRSDQAIGLDLLDLIEGRDPLVHFSDWLGQAPGTQAEQVARFRLKRGSRELRVRLRRAEGGAAVAALVMDGVESRLLAELEQRRERTDLIGKLLREGVIVTDAQGIIIEFSGAAEHMTAWRDDEALGQPIERILKVIDGAGDHVDWFAIGPLSPTAGALHYESVSLISREGRRLSVRVGAHPFQWSAAAAPGAVFIVADITVNELLAEELNYRSTHDALTGLLSREEFERRLSSLIGEAHSEHHQHAFAYLDLDQFKVINDTLGHFAGDELLRQFAGHLRALLSSRDVFARLGGDEFGVLMPHRDPKEAEQMVRDMLEATRAFRFRWDGLQYGLTTSIGLTLITDQTGSAAMALSEADAACFASKDAGRDRLHIAGANDETLRRRGEMGMVSRINRALDLDLFELHFEDVVRCSNPGQVVYRELLVRMKDEERPGQLVPPSLFIPAAERYFLMGALDRWVINKACEGVARHPTDGVLYAVNVSGLSLNDENFLGYVLDCFNRHGVAPEQICFEITETAAISHLKEARDFIERLVNVGCCFALDDFGVGMSSFSYLKNLPVAFLKIDGGFVRSMVQNRVDRGMVEAINRIGHEMNLKTIAEHVESPEVLAVLTAMGVDYAQGWAISRGKPFDTLLTPVA
jgi:diguanylate cyclase (GGDEF)-like protein/PAS domain S-box-containing protein